MLWLESKANVRSMSVRWRQLKPKMLQNHSQGQLCF
uniref:Uncharacterized protein n=1 Tax=Rhizophora mucronata TaxID=61149 RepID=A0A2P2QJR7_RHIMU